MATFIRIFTLFIYLTLLYELVGIPVPSVASTYQLFFTRDDFPMQGSLLAKVRRWPLLLKILFLMLPTAMAVLIYLLPFVQALWPGLARYLHFVVSPGILWMVLIGITLVLLGRYVGLTAAWMMHHAQIESTAQFEFKTKGMFSFSRNPILLGMYFTFIGLWFLYPTWEMGLGFLILVLNMHFRVLLEEDFLSWHYGSPYREFVAKTRRYL